MLGEVLQIIIFKSIKQIVYTTLMYIGKISKMPFTMTDDLRKQKPANSNMLSSQLIE